MKKANRSRRVKRFRRLAAGVMAGTMALTGGTSVLAATPTAGVGERTVKTAVTAAPATSLTTNTGTTTYSKWRWYRGTRTPTTPTPTAPAPVTPAPTPTPTPVVTAPTTSAAATADRVVEIAKSLQGRVQYGPYNEATLSMDCSGFTYYVYKQVGIDLGTRDDDRQVLLGTNVPRSQLQKGDLIFLWNESSTSKTDVGHVGIYIGDGKYIHSAGSTLDVVISNVNSGWAADHYITARRVIK